MDYDWFPFERGTSVHDFIRDNYEKPPTRDYDFIPVTKKYNASTADIHYISNLVMLGNEYEDVFVVPDYQRGLVWTLSQKQNLIMSILNGNPIGDFIFKKRFLKGSNGRSDGVKVEWTVIDGQQRINALKEFIGNKFKLKNGLRFRDLKYWDAREFALTYKINAITFTGITYEQEVEIYFNRNFGGTAHSMKELERIKKIREDIRSAEN
jgi:hypothetical protein